MRRLRILTFCPYPLLPIRGGAMRIYHLVRELLRWHEVHLIVHQPLAELAHSPDGRKVPEGLRLLSSVDEPPPSSWLDRLPFGLSGRIRCRLLTRRLGETADGTMLLFSHLVERVARSVPVDVVVYEHITTLAAEPYVRRLLPGALRVLDAHNVEHRLSERLIALQRASGEPVTREDLDTLRRVRRAEATLGRHADGFWACSEEDRRVLEAFSGVPGYSIANGIDTTYLAFDPRTDKVELPEIVFCGNMVSPPNVDGLRFFCREIWPRIRGELPGLGFAVVGSGFTPELAAEVAAHPGVRVVGEVPDIRPAMYAASVAVVPLRAGSGTRGKIVEAMSLGNPVVSTRLGAEGIAVTDRAHLLLADEPAEFAAAVVGLLRDRERFEGIRRRARAHAVHAFEWHLIGERANRSLHELLGRLERRRA